MSLSTSRRSALVPSERIRLYSKDGPSGIPLLISRSMSAVELMLPLSMPPVCGGTSWSVVEERRPGGSGYVELSRERQAVDRACARRHRHDGYPGARWVDQREVLVGTVGTTGELTVQGRRVDA